MRFATPAGFAAAALVVPLVLWYVLRARRPRMPVASTFLWERADRTVAAAVPWQRFRGDVTFWLVLAALIAGTLALARPYIPVAAELGEHTILVVDTSASMLADEDGPTRLRLARREAANLLDRMGPGRTVSVVEAGPRARVLLSASPDAGAAVRALDDLRPAHGDADLTDAFTLAASLERPDQDTVVHLLTDGEVPAPHRADVPAGTRVTAVGTPRPNLAVTRLQALPLGGGRAQVFAQVRNHGTTTTEATLSLAATSPSRVDDGGTELPEPLVQRRLRLPARSSEDVVLEVPTTGGQGGGVPSLVASVAPAGSDITGERAGDALTADDRAFAVLSEPRDVAVLLVTDGNVFLEAALESLPHVTLETATTVPDDPDRVDLLVVDRAAPPSPLRTPALLVAPTSPPEGVTVTGEVERPTVTFQEPGHQLMASVDLSEVAISRAQEIDAPAFATVTGGPDGPLAVAGRAGAVPVVYLTFDLRESNLPLQPTWPVLVANTVAWLAGPPTVPPAVAGQEVTVPAAVGAVEGTLTGPGGTQTLDPASPRFHAETAGVYSASWQRDDGTVLDTAHVAVNVPPAEGDLARPAPAERPDAATPSAGTTAEGRRDLTRELLAVVVALALVEWLYATRSSGRRKRRSTAALSAPEVAG